MRWDGASARARKKYAHDVFCKIISQLFAALFASSSSSSSCCLCVIFVEHVSVRLFLFSKKMVCSVHITSKHKKNTKYRITQRRQTRGEE